MENKINRQLYSSSDSLRNQLTNWSESAKNYYDQLNLFKVRVNKKCTTNDLEKQMKNDVILNLNTLMNRVQDDLIRHISKLQNDINTNSKKESHLINDQTNVYYNDINERMKQIQKSVLDLRRRSKHFLKRTEFGKRHGFYRFFMNDNETQRMTLEK